MISLITFRYLYYIYQNFLKLKHFRNYLLILIFSLNCKAQNFQLKIQGSTQIENKTIDSITYSANHNNVKSIENEIRSILEKLSKKGYTESQLIKLTKTNNFYYTANLNLGEKINYIHIYIGRNSELKKLTSQNQNKDSVTIPYTEIESFLNTTLYKFEQEGYAFTKLKLQNITREKNTLYAELEFEKDSTRKINSIVIKKLNNEEKNFLPKGHITQINKKYKNKVYNQKTVNLINKEFENLGFAIPVKQPEILFTRDTTKIYIYLKKRKSNNFDGFIGFKTNENNKLALNGYLDLKLENILLTGEQFSLYWKSDEKKQKTFKTAIEIPYLLNSPVGIRAQIEIFKQDSTYQNTKTAIDLGYYFNYKTHLYIGHQSTISSDIQNTNNYSISDYKNSYITTNIEFTDYDNNNKLFPLKKALIIKTGVGKRNTNNQIENNKQYFINIYTDYNFNINKKNIFNIKNQSYYLNSTNYTINELYRFGGIKSIRGFTENSLQANLMTAFLTEYRYVITPSLYIHTILDYCYLKDPFNTNRIEKKEKLLGTGLGLSAVTKNGILQISIANGIKKNEELKFHNTIIHLSYNVKFWMRA